MLEQLLLFSKICTEHNIVRQRMFEAYVWGTVLISCIQLHPSGGNDQVIGGGLLRLQMGKICSPVS